MPTLPIVLAHGIAASERFPHEFMWGRIPEALRKHGFAVFLGGTDAMGTYQTNAAQLNATVARVCEHTGSRRVIVLAHSKGGLDARYCLSAHDRGQRIAALVTMSTPHHGSALADAIAEELPKHANTLRSLSRTLGNFFLDRQPAALEMLAGLTTHDMVAFNRDETNVPGVYYRSYYTVLRNAFDELALAASYRLLKARAGANDGVVSARSAQWGDSPEEVRGISGGISHLEIVDLKRRKISGVSIPDIWVELASKTAAAL